MTVEQVEEMPEGNIGIRNKYIEVVQAVKKGAVGDKFKFDVEDGKKISAGNVREMIERHTQKSVLVVKQGNVTCFIKILSPEEAKKEEGERKKRAEVMKKKLEGKKK